MSALVFLGAGRITTALIAGLRRAGYPGAIVVHDRHEGKMHRLAREYSVTPQPSLSRALAAAGLLIIAVRPGSVGELLGELEAEFSRRGRGNKSTRRVVAVSLAAGVPLAVLRKCVGTHAQWTRAMPSPLCRSGRGLTALTFDRTMPPRKRTEIRKLFSRVGQVLVIPERHFDAFTVTYSSSHGYHALSTLATAAEKLGLPRHLALAAAAHALGDGVMAWREHRQPLEALIAEAATPGGTAAAVMAALQEQGFARIVERALRAGFARARRNAKPRAPFVLAR